MINWCMQQEEFKKPKWIESQNECTKWWEKYFVVFNKSENLQSGKLAKTYSIPQRNFRMTVMDGLLH